MKPNRFDDLETEWADFGKDWERTRAEWKALDKEQKQIKGELQRLWRGYFLLAVIVALLLAGRLWQ